MKKIHTEKAPKAVGPYSQGVQIGGMLFLSGQAGLDPETGKLVEGLEMQAHRVCKNLAAVLDEAGYGFEHIVKTTCFLVDMADFAAFNAIYEMYFVSKPARSCVAVKQLPLGAVCEIEAIAYKA